MSESERLVQGQPKKISHDQPLAWLQPHRTSESVSHFLASSKCDYSCRSCCFLFFFLMSSIVSPQSLVLFSFFVCNLSCLSIVSTTHQSIAFKPGQNLFQLWYCLLILWTILIITLMLMYWCYSHRHPHLEPETYKPSVSRDPSGQINYAVACIGAAWSQSMSPPCPR